MTVEWSLAPSIVAIVVSGGVLVVAGVRLTRVADALADRTGIGEAVAGAVLLGAVTSLSGLVTTVVGAASGDAGFALSNAAGGIAAQTAFLALADLTYRRVNLEHAAASIPNLTQTMLLVSMLGLVLAAITAPDRTFLAVHPATVLLVGMYLYGVRLTQRAHDRPMWRPRRTRDTVDDVAEEHAGPMSAMWVRFVALAALVAGTGWVVATAGLSIADRTGLSGSLVGAAFTGVVTSLPELVTVLAAVRIGAVTLAVGDIIGGNAFDVLFVAAADLAFREGSVYHAADTQATFLIAVTVVLTAVAAAGMLGREERHIGFEGVAILVFYALGIVSLVALG